MQHHFPLQALLALLGACAACSLAHAQADGKDLQPFSKDLNTKRESLWKAYAQWEERFIALQKRLKDSKDGREQLWGAALGEILAPKETRFRDAFNDLANRLNMASQERPELARWTLYREWDRAFHAARHVIYVLSWLQRDVKQVPRGRRRADLAALVAIDKQLKSAIEGETVVARPFPPVDSARRVALHDSVIRCTDELVAKLPPLVEPALKKSAPQYGEGLALTLKQLLASLAEQRKARKLLVKKEHEALRETLDAAVIELRRAEG